MLKELKGRVALITGGSRGIGKAIAEKFTENGASVIICARNTKKTENEINDTRSVSLDVNDAGEINQLFESFKEYKFDILVNNVGGLEKFGKFEDLTDDDWLNAFNLNLMSMVRFSRLAIPHLKKSPNPRIINISSLVAHQPGKFNPHYGVAKAGMLYLNKYLANELAEHNILVNVICPGIIQGGGWGTNVEDRAKRDGITCNEAEQIMVQEGSKKIPLGKLGTVEDIAELSVFLASDRAKFITGQCFDVDGGMNRSIL